MRKILAVLVATLLLGSVGLSTAHAADRASAVGIEDSGKTTARASLLQRLLGNGMTRALQVFGVFGSLTPVGAAPNTIIDEPDPAGKKDGSGKDDNKDNERTDEQELEQELIDSPGSKQKQVYG